MLPDLLSLIVICTFGLLLTFRLVSGACTLEIGPPSDPANSDRQDRERATDRQPVAPRQMSDLG
jgi:hypothetical protein